MKEFLKGPRPSHDRHKIVFAVIIIVAISVAVLLLLHFAPNLLTSSSQFVLGVAGLSLPGSQDLTAGNAFENVGEEESPFDITNPFEYSNPFGD